MSGPERTRRAGAGPDPDPEERACDLAGRRRLALKRGRARRAALRRWWAGLGSAGRSALERNAMDPAEDRREGETG